MKYTSLAIFVAMIFATTAYAQEQNAEESALYMAKNDFSKEKQVIKEKYGVIKQKSRSVISIPDVKDNIRDYSGRYEASGAGYQIDIWVTNYDQISATLITEDKEKQQHFYSLKNIKIDYAYFRATKVNEDGSEDLWEGVFINKNDDGTVSSGLGIKLTKAGNTDVDQRSEKMFFQKL